MYNSVSEKMKSLEAFSYAVGNPEKELINEVEFHDSLYIKVLPTYQLVKIASAREERYIKSKI